MYPQKLDLNYAVLIEALRSISQEYLRIDDSKTLSEHCQEKNIDVEEVEELIQRIKDCLNDF